MGCVVAALGAVAYLLLDPATADHAAQEYRAWLVRDAGLGLWDNGWFAGHHTPAYSLLSPPLGALLGVRLAGALAAVVAAGLFGLVAERRWGPRAGSVAAAWFAVGLVATLVSGRLTFVLGVASASPRCSRCSAPLASRLRARRAHDPRQPGRGPVRRDRRRGSGAGGSTAPPRAARRARRARRARARARSSPSSSPRAGPSRSSRRPSGPRSSRSRSSPSPCPPRARRCGRRGDLRARVRRRVRHPDALGGNATRLGALLAGPVLAGAILAAPGRRAILAALVLPLAYWQLYPAVRDVVRAHGDPSTARRLPRPARAFLEAGPAASASRSRSPRTTGRRRTSRRTSPLARGWERQLDRRYGALFYDGTLTATTYRAWLDEHAVAYVAVPDVPLDYAARDEAKLIARRPPYLRPVWRSRALARLRGPRPRAARQRRRANRSSSSPRASRSAPARGNALVRVRHTRWWAVTDGRACVERGPSGMTRVRVLRPGTVRVQARLGGSACRR